MIEPRPLRKDDLFDRGNSLHKDDVLGMIEWLKERANEHIEHRRLDVHASAAFEIMKKYCDEAVANLKDSLPPLKTKGSQGVREIR